MPRLQARLGLRSSGRSHLWIGLSGWLVAAILGGVLLFHQKKAVTGPRETPNLQTPASVGNAPPTTAANAKTTKVETKRLAQEIEVLRDNLEKYQTRDRILFAPVPGKAMPVVMTMNPPGTGRDDSPTLPKSDVPAPLTAMLGDALRAMTSSASSSAQPATASADHPTAIPIYDASRDAGTLVVSNLPPTSDAETYNLWVTTAASNKPVFVGSLPHAGAQEADSFDFSLGSTMILPSGFILTRDPADAPASPAETNTVLIGPPTAEP